MLLLFSECHYQKNFFLILFISQNQHTLRLVYADFFIFWIVIQKFKNNKLLK